MVMKCSDTTSAIASIYDVGTNDIVKYSEGIHDVE